MSGRARRRADEGASAVEFALVVPVLLLILFGIIDYGIFFANSLGSRTGEREAARQASVENFPGNCTGLSTTGNSDLRKVACLAVTNTSVASGSVFARAELPSGWNQGDDIVVCVAVDSRSVTGVIPLPNSGEIRTKLRMRIEQDTGSRSGSGQAGTSGNVPTGGWSWCS